MSDPAIAESRRILRRVQTHLAQSQLNLGTTREHDSLVDVVYHPSNYHPLLNYVSPRKNTAWVPGPEIKRGLDRLRELDRTPRVIYIEGLYPPLFAKTIRDLGMVVEQEIALMTYAVNQDNRPEERKPLTLSDQVRVDEVDNPAASTLWWLLWNSARSESLTKTLEPLQAKGAAQKIGQERQVDLILYKRKAPLAVARVTIHEATAHIAALAVLKIAREPEMVKLFYQVAVEAALKRNCTLVFTANEIESEHQLCRDLGFVDSGSAVCYVEAANTQKEETTDEQVAQSVFVLRKSKAPQPVTKPPTPQPDRP